MDKDTAERIAKLLDDPVKSGLVAAPAEAVYWAGGMWGIEAPTGWMDAKGTVVYLAVGSDDDGNVGAQVLTLHEGPLCDGIIQTGLTDTDTDAIVAWIREYRCKPVSDLLAMCSC